jgi:pimeloyl-ACP methyl ester carboxylesterase
LADDVDTVRQTIKMQDGPVSLVGHSWGGAVITEAGNEPQVRGPIYIAAAAPDSGLSGDNYFSLPCCLINKCYRTIDVVG